MSENRFIKYIPSEKTTWLRKNHTALYLLLSVIAERARWNHEESPEGLKQGDAILGESAYLEAGISRQQYRDAIEKGEKFQMFEVVWNPKNPKQQKRTIKGTMKTLIVNLKGCVVWDLNLIKENHIKNQEGTMREPSENHKQRKKEYKESKEEVYAHEAHSNSSFYLNADEDSKVIQLDKEIFENEQVLIQSEHNLYNQTNTSEIKEEENEIKSNNIEQKEIKQDKKINNIRRNKVKSSAYEESLVVRLKIEGQELAVIRTSEAEHKELIEKYGENLTQSFYSELLDWKRSKISKGDSKSVKAHTDFYRIKNWIIEKVKGKSVSSPQNSHINQNQKDKNISAAVHVQKNFVLKAGKIDIFDEFVQFSSTNFRNTRIQIFFRESSSAFNEQVKSALVKYEARKIENNIQELAVASV